MLRALGVCLLLVLGLVVTVETIGTGIKGAIKQQTFDMVKARYLPIIIESIRNVRIDDKHFDWGPFSVTISNIHARVDDLPPGNVQLYLKPNSNRVGFSIGGVGASGGVDVSWSFLFIRGDCHINVRIHSVGASFDVVASVDGDGRPIASISGLSLHLDTGNVDAWASCGFVSGLYDFVIGIIKPGFVGQMHDNIESTVPDQVNKALKDFIGTFNLWVDIGPNFALTWRLTKSPWVNADYLCVSLAGYIYLKSKPQPPAHDPPWTPDYNPHSAKGAQVFITDYTMGSGLYAAFAAGLLTVQYQVAIDKYDVTFDCGALTPPALTLDSEIEVTAKGRCSIKAKDRTSGLVLSFAIKGDGMFMTKEYIKDQTLFFRIKQLNLFNMEIDNPEKYDIRWFEEAINEVLRSIANAINETLGQRGIRLPYIDRLQYTDIEEKVRRGYIEVFVTPYLKGPLPERF